MTLAAKLVLALVLFVAGFGAGIKWHKGIDAQEAEKLHEQQAREAVRMADKVDTAAVHHEADKTQIRTVIRTVTKEVERVVKEPFYVDRDAPACLDDAGLQQLRAAIAAAPAGSEPARAVPRPDGAR